LRRNHYETAIIINAALDDEQIEAVVAKITGIITQASGVISETEKWGRKRLAYTINKNRIGYYIIYRYEAPVDLIAEFERLLKIDESVVRFLTVRLEKEALEYFATKKTEAEAVETTEVPAEVVTEVAPEVVAETVVEVAPEAEAEVAVEEVIPEVETVEEVNAEKLPVVEEVVPEVLEEAPVPEVIPDVATELPVETAVEEVETDKKEETDEPK
jgi:small subunit ribosomal protein S6